MAQNNKKIELDIDAKIKSANAETDLRKLSRQLRDLNSELSKIGDTSSEDFIKLSEAISKVEGKIGDASDRLKTITGEPLERVNNGMSLLSDGLMNLDFDKATIGIDGMADGFGKMNFADIKEGIGKVATSFANLGKALLSNPYFLLISATVLLIMNFEKLTKIVGPIGDIFRIVGKAIQFITDAVSQLTDAIGLTTVELDKQTVKLEEVSNTQKVLIENQKKLAEAGKLTMSSLAADIFALSTNYKQASNDLDLFLEKNKRAAKDIKDESRYADAAIQKEYEDKLNIFDEARNNLFASTVDIKTKLDDINLQTLKSQSESYIATIDNKEKAEKAKLQLDYKYNKEAAKIEKERLEKSLVDIEDTILNVKNSVGFASNAALGETVKNLESIKQLTKTSLENLNRDVNTSGVKLQKELNQITLNYTLERIETQKTILKNASDTQLKQVEINSKKGLVTTQQFELQKQSVIVDRLNNESKLVKDTFDKQIMFYSKTEKAAKENADIIKLLESTKAKLLNDINQDIEDITLTTNNNIKKNTEEVYKERENYAKEAYEIEKQLIDAQIASTQNLIDINNVRIQELNSTANQYKNVLEEETDAIMENYGNQLFLLDEQKQKELKINENNTINRKEKELEIEAKYNALIKKSGLDTAEAITAAKIKEIDRQMSYFKAGLEGATLLADIAQNIDDQRRKDGEEQSFKAASKEFVIRQGLAAAGVIMSTSESVMKSVAASPLTGGMPWTAINIGMGALQLAKILTTKFNFNGGGGSVAGAGGGSTNVTAPDMAQQPNNPFFSQGYMNQNIGPNGMVGFRPGKDNSMIKVGVYESDIRNVMNKVNVLETRSTLSGAGN
jgi:hypothetical protein